MDKSGLFGPANISPCSIASEWMVAARYVFHLYNFIQMQHKKSNGWAITWLITIVLSITYIVIGFRSGVDPGTIFASLASILATLTILVGAWVFVSLEELPTGVYIDIGSIGGGYIKPKLGHMPGFIINDPSSKYNYDTRYPDFEVIPLKQLTDDEGNRVYRWDYPGYEDWQEGDLRPKPTFDRTWKEDRPWFERKYDYTFIGLKPFYKVLVRRVPQHKMVPYLSVEGKITGKKEDRDDYPEWSIRWKDQSCTNVVLSLTEERRHHPLFWDEVIVSKELETGVPEKEEPVHGPVDHHHADEESDKNLDDLLQIDLISEGQLQVTNPYDIFTKSPRSADSADAAMQAGMRVYIAHITIDLFQKENHLSSKEPAGYQQTVASLSGKFEKDDHEHYVLTPGLRKNSGIKFTAKLYLTAWSASNKRSQLLIEARQEVFIKRQGLIVGELEGKTAAARITFELNGKKQAEVDYKTAMAEIPVPLVMQATLNAVKEFASGGLRVVSFGGKKNPISQMIDVASKYLTEDDTAKKPDSVDHGHAAAPHGHDKPDHKKPHDSDHGEDHEKPGGHEPDDHSHD